MKELELLQTIVIPRYITRILVAKARRAKYFKKGNKIPKKYENDDYVFKDGRLVDKDGELVIANPRVHGKPRYEPLSGNKLTSGYSTPFMRNKIATSLKDFYRPYIKSMRVMTDFPIQMDWEFHTTVDRPNFDLSNFWFYLKYFEDTLVTEGIIPDDSIKYITRSASPLLVPVDKFSSRKFVFRFYHDKRPQIQDNPVWRDLKSDK
jgi:hypothetical protein